MVSTLKSPSAQDIFNLSVKYASLAHKIADAGAPTVQTLSTKPTVWGVLAKNKTLGIMDNQGNLDPNNKNANIVYDTVASYDNAVEAAKDAFKKAEDEGKKPQKTPLSEANSFGNGQIHIGVSINGGVVSAVSDCESMGYPILIDMLNKNITPILRSVLNAQNLGTKDGNWLGIANFQI